MSNLSVSKAILAGLREEMLRDENVVILGASFAVTRGLLEEFGEMRVRDTPISESGFCGMAVGMAMRGIRPVVELMYDDFISVALDPVMNQAAYTGCPWGPDAATPDSTPSAWSPCSCTSPG